MSIEAMGDLDAEYDTLCQRRCFAIDTTYEERQAEQLPAPYIKQ